MTQPDQERIVCVAILLPLRTDVSDTRQAFVVASAPARHHHVLHQLWRPGWRASPGAGQGFVTSTGRYVDREEAWEIAKAAGQLLACAPTDGRGGRLYSEDVW